MSKSKDAKTFIIIPPLLVDISTAGKILSISKSFLLQLDASGKIPQPIHLGKRRLWRVEDLQRWVSMGCCSRREFEERGKADG